MATSVAGYIKAMTSEACAASLEVSTFTTVTLQANYLTLAKFETINSTVAASKAIQFTVRAFDANYSSVTLKAATSKKIKNLKLVKVSNSKVVASEG